MGMGEELGADRVNERYLRYQIRRAGFTPQQRDILYNYVSREASTI